MASPLFRNAARLFKQAEAEFRKSPAGTILREVQALSQGRKGSPAKLSQALRRAGKQQPHKLIQESVGAEMGDIARSMLRYAKGGAKDRAAIDQFLKAMGPIGQALKAIMGPVRAGETGTTASLSAAINLIRSAGMEVLPGMDVKGGPQFERAFNAVQQWAESQGYTLRPTDAPPGAIGTTPGMLGGLPPERPAMVRGKQQLRKTVDIPMSAGGSKRYPVSHPLVTGEFVTTPNSTNVHSFGYDMPNAILYVRFLGAGPEGRRAGEGSLYRYSPVTPEEFDQLYRVRRGGGGEDGSSTPGTWIWATLRVRGTISQHQKDYALVGVMDRYVPRKATLHPEQGEMFIERKVRTLGGDWISSLPGRSVNTRLSQAVQIGSATMNATPNRGRPSRGRPNTGRP